MQFLDNLGKAYSVNIGAFYRSWIESDRDKAKMTDFTGHAKLNLMSQRKSALDKGSSRMIESMKDRARIAANIMNGYMDPTDEEANHQVRDCHLYEIFDQLDLDPVDDIHLLFVIENFVVNRSNKPLDDKNKHNYWKFRITQDGQIYWMNHFTKEACFDYPHLDLLQSKIDKFRENHRETPELFVKDSL